MTHEERLELARVLGTIDHLITMAEIDLKVYRPDDTEDDQFMRGLCRGKTESAEYTIRKLSQIRPILETVARLEAESE